MAADQTALDAAIADIGTHADSIDAAVTALVAKIEASPSAPDFSSEVAALQAATGNLQTATDDANTALAAGPAAPVSPVAPAEGPAVVSAVTDDNPTGPNPPDSLEQGVIDDASAVAAAQAENVAAPDPAVSAPVPGDPASTPTLVSGPQTSGVVADDGTVQADGSVAPDAADASDGLLSPPAPDDSAA